ncbi:hypothetical protein ACN2XU_21230 [Primorskyibacter sp. 2E107]|uniref:hypothetical protein n=1 Tax=Primorskyibacter sp. 2E107 TaxID=3403458 RepID=UPI003AF65874
MTAKTSEPAMTHRLAIILGLLIIVAFAVDYAFYDTKHLVFLAKKMLDLIEWLAFWR